MAHLFAGITPQVFVFAVSSGMSELRAEQALEFLGTVSLEVAFTAAEEASDLFLCFTLVREMAEGLAPLALEILTLSSEISGYCLLLLLWGINNLFLINHI